MFISDVDQLACRQGHHYDAAKQGYYNLLTGRGTKFQADTADMVRARENFQNVGHYVPLADAVADAVQRSVNVEASLLLDVGAGTGYYLERLQQRIVGTDAVALDISRYGLRRCARTEGRPLSLVWDVWQRLPLQNAAIDVIINIFAPRNFSEFHRVLRPDGRLVVVTPLPGHLQELRETVGMLDVDEDKASDLRKSVQPLFEELESREISYSMHLNQFDVVNAVLMGPSAFHTTVEAVESSASCLTSLDVTARFSLQVFGPVATVPIPSTM
ncbi:methyltransferase domain-containing protein [Arthrobacter roseus]